MRKYQLIWEGIKTSKVLSVEAPVARHCKIVAAVRKEKGGDAGWRLLMSEDNKRFKLKNTSAGNILTFYLEEDTSNYLSDMKL